MDRQRQRVCVGAQPALRRHGSAQGKLEALVMAIARVVVGGVDADWKER